VLRLSVVLVLVLLTCGCHASAGSSSSTTPSPVPGKLCIGVGGAWDTNAGRCTVSKDGPGGVHTQAEAVYPVDLIDNATSGPVLGSFVRKFLTDYSAIDDRGSGGGHLKYSIVSHEPNTKTVVFHADWHFDSMPHPVAEITTFTFDFDAGKQLQLADLFCPGVDAVKAIPPIARPFVQRALVGSPFAADRFEPDQPAGDLADNYQAWALDADDLVLYMPAARGPGGVPPGFITPRIPLTEFGSIMRGKGCSSSTS
jgi:hypothetical protein